MAKVRRAAPEAMTTHAQPRAAKGGIAAGDPVFGRVFRAGPFAARAVLGSVRRGLATRGVPRPVCEDVELVLAEVINNVVEHAYADGDGPITLTVSLAPGRIICLIQDEGAPMGAARPAAGLAPVPAPVPPASEAALPEGGFGWGLIHQLTSVVEYRRDGSRNRLHLEIAREQ
ncbi:ATP-binding protein [Rhodobacteraceae bacterium WD3A24]|nr:ATP-binding protein [Rhodobacteraceae bacterium WD3A24]